MFEGSRVPSGVKQGDEGEVLGRGERSLGMRGGKGETGMSSGCVAAKRQKRGGRHCQHNTIFAVNKLRHKLTIFLLFILIKSVC